MKTLIINTKKIFLIGIFMQSILLFANIEDKPKLEIFPNPTSQNLNLKLLGNADYQITICNIIGNAIYTSEIYSSFETIHTLNLTEMSLTNGIYFVKIMHNNHVVATQRLIFKPI